MGCNKRSSKREVFSNTSQPQEIRKTSNKEPNLTPKPSRERIIIIIKKPLTLVEIKKSYRSGQKKVKQKQRKQ